jgi:large subunit ribosomal protein L25
MKENFELNAEVRDVMGKGASRRLRHANKIPAVMYGGAKVVQLLTLDHNEVSRHLEHEAFYSHILTVKVGESEEKAVLRDLHRHPSKPRILHLDLQRVSATEKIRMRVPLHFIGADVAPGVKQSGGIVSHLVSDVEVMCLASQLPEYIEADLTNLQLNETLHMSGLKVPEGVDLVMTGQGAQRDRAVASIHLPRAAIEETPVVVADATAAVPAEGKADTTKPEAGKSDKGDSKKG